MTSKPSIILVPGAWHRPIVYSAVEIGLRLAGFTDTYSLQLPSSGGDPPPVNREPDIAVIRSAITARLQDGKDVVLVAHSYGGLPASEAVEGLPTKSTTASKPDTPQEPSSPASLNYSGRILGIVYIACLLVPVGGSYGTTLDNPIPPWCRLDDVKVYISSEESAVAGLYNDLNAAAGSYWYHQLTPHQSYGGLIDVGRYAPWTGDVKCKYIACENDATLPVEVQRALIHQDGAVIEEVVCTAGHSPMLSQPDLVVDVIKSMAGDGGATK